MYFGHILSHGVRVVDPAKVKNGNDALRKILLL